MMRHRTFRNIPLALVGKLDNVVIAYGESTPRERSGRRSPPWPVYWVAERLVSGERFACAIRTTTPLPDSLLEHFELTRDDFSKAVPLEEARMSWASFLRPGDTLAVYHQSVANLLTHLGGRIAAPPLVLKSVALKPHRRHGTLDELVKAEGLASAPAQHPGRAGKRLANASALVHHLNALGNAARHGGRGEECLVRK